MITFDNKIHHTIFSPFLILSLLGCVFLTISTAANLSGQEDVIPDSVDSTLISAQVDQEEGSTATQTRTSWFHRGRLNVVIIVAIFFGLVLVLTSWAKRGKVLRVKEISGIQAIEMAIEKAAEMKKPVVYVPGVFDVDNIQTIASMAILVDVAKKTAEKGVRLIVPLNRAFLIPLAEESVKIGMGKVGKAELFNPDDIRYLSDDQFAYAAAVDGIILREKPAAAFYLGGFGAEALILAEMGYSAGAMQIAGTAETLQLPFLVAACDHTLIGEEFFAASAYISKETKLLGTLRAADVMKAVIILLLILGSILELLDVHLIANWLTVQ